MALIRALVLSSSNRKRPRVRRHARGGVGCRARQGRACAVARGTRGVSAQMLFARGDRASRQSSRSSGARDNRGGDRVSVSGEAQTRTFGGRTAWARNLGAPVRDFLSTQTGGAAVMALATVAALVWANSPWWHSYESVWSTTLAVRVGGAGISADLRGVGQRGLDDDVLPRRGSRGQARVRLGRVARPASGDSPGSGGDRRDRRARRDLRRVQRRRFGCAWVGRGDVDRQRLCAGCARAAHPAFGDAAARIPADALGGRRSVRAGGDRGRLHGPRVAGRTRGRRRPVRACSWGCVASARREGRSRSRWRSRCGWRCSSRA